VVVQTKPSSIKNTKTGVITANSLSWNIIFT